LTYGRALGHPAAVHGSLALELLHDVLFR
jgi:hypothetical protein